MKRDATNAVIRLTNSQGQRLRAECQTGAKRSSLAAQTRHRERVLVGGHANEVDHRVNRQPADELSALVDDRHRHEIVPFERPRRLCRGVVREEGERI